MIQAAGDDERASNYADTARNVETDVCDIDGLQHTRIETRGDLQISHQTGAKSIAFSLQSSMLIPLVRQSPPIQRIYRTQPVFHAKSGQ